MNKENLLRVADAMEKQEYPVGYNQEGWRDKGALDCSGRGCGTTMCIAGWAEVVRTGKLTFNVDYVSDRAAKFLDLTSSQERDLFRAFPFMRSRPSLADAVAVLRYAAEHDVINWNAANAETAP